MNELNMELSDIYRNYLYFSQIHQMVLKTKHIQCINLLLYASIDILYILRHINRFLNSKSLLQFYRIYSTFQLFSNHIDQHLQLIGFVNRQLPPLFPFVRLHFQRDIGTAFYFSTASCYIQFGA